MESFKGLNMDREDGIVLQTRVISGIVENLEEGNVRSLIDCFNPLIRNFPDLIKQQMLEHCKKWANKKEIFIGAINYIEHGKQDTRNSKLEHLDVDSLTDIFLKEIENRMPVHCRQCDEWYILR